MQDLQQQFENAQAALEESRLQVKDAVKLVQDQQENTIRCLQEQLSTAQGTAKLG